MDFKHVITSTKGDSVIEIAIDQVLFNSGSIPRYKSASPCFEHWDYAEYGEVNKLGTVLSIIPGVVEATISRYIVQLHYVAAVFEDQPIINRALELISNYLKWRDEHSPLKEVKSAF